MGFLEEMRKYDYDDKKKQGMGDACCDNNRDYNDYIFGGLN